MTRKVEHENWYGQLNYGKKSNKKNRNRIKVKAIIQRERPINDAQECTSMI